MTEQTPDDLQSIADAIASIPDEFAELRALLHRVPSLTQPEIQSVRDAMLDSATGAGGIGGGLSLVSNQAVGHESGGVIGIDPQLYFGMANMLENPTFESARTALTTNTSYQDLGGPWEIKHVLNSGTAPTTRTTQKERTRYSTGLNPFNSDMQSLDVVFGASACDIDFIVRDKTLYAFTGIPLLPNLLAGIRIQKPLGGTYTGVTSISVFMEIVNSSDTVLATSTGVDFLTLEAVDETPLVQAIQAGPSASIRWRMRINIVKAASTPSFSIYFAEPQLQMAFTESPRPYAPLLGRWNPIPSGSVFPAAADALPVDFRFWREDLNLEFFFDSSDLIWKSSEVFTMTYAFPGIASGATSITATSTAIVMPAPPLQGGSDIWLLNHESQIFITGGGSALSGSHKWVGTLNKRPTGNTQVSVGVKNVDSGSSGVWRTFTTVIDALMNDGTDYFVFDMAWVKTGTPGAFQSADTLTYRIVAT